MVHIQIIPHCIGTDGNGRECSMFSSSARIVTETGKWTWRHTDANGTVTYGLGRAPVDTYAEALEVAQSIPDATVEGWA